ncbi:MAG TPA: hydantoinase B/oxoprolinase family protein [bacterium]|nr:hydantoinase B/oxoprolinase family protein [bacterium]
MTAVVDPITLEVVDNALYSMEKEMEATIVRTAMSIVIRDIYDFGISTLDAGGRLVHGLPMSGTLIREVFPLDEIHEGDVFVFNDPYLSRGEMTHLGDTQLCRPVFAGGRLIAFAAVWGHHMDIGGISVSGLPATSREIFHEGIQIPPVKLYERDILNDAVLKIMARNSRTPEMMIGDTLAMAAACTITEKRLHELVDKFGLDTVLACFDTYAARAHEAMGRLIAGLPDRRVAFEDFLDDDGVREGALRLCVALEKRGDRLHLDYTGTAGQAEGAINLILNPNRVTLEMWRYLLNWIGPQLGMDAEASPNYGVFDLVDVTIPHPSLLSPAYPAAVGARHLTSSMIYRDTFRGLMSQLFPGSVPACSNGVIPTYMFRGTHPVTGKGYVSMECIAGGGGGRPDADGIDALCPNANLIIAPVEFLETTYPLLVEQTALRRDTAGPGRFRGGAGVIRSFELRAPEAYLSWLDDRQTHPAWGLDGGRPGVPGDAYLVRGGRTFRLPTKYDNLRLEQGDRIVVRTGGGGGNGCPWERSPALVARDVLRGFVSVAKAQEEYGVVFLGDELRVDDAATEARRRELARRPVERVDRGTVLGGPPPGRLLEVDGIPERP